MSTLSGFLTFNLRMETSKHSYRVYSALLVRHPTAWIMLLLILLIFPIIAAGFGNSWVRMMDMVLLYTMMALGLNLVVGFAGLLDLGYIAFYALGAYLTALLASPQFALFLSSLAEHYPVFGQMLITYFGTDIASQGLHLPIWLILPSCALLAGLLGAVLGAPTLKLRGDYLAVVTLGFGEIIRVLLINLNAPINLTDGPKGINMIDPVSLFGVSLAGEGGMVNLPGFAMPSVNAYYYVFLALCMVIVFVSLRLENSRLGRAFVAIREDEMAAKAMGINTRNMKLLVFALGASFGGLAGCLFASFQRFISPESFALNESVAVLAMVVLGGMGHIPGVILGSVILAALPEVLRHLVEPLQLYLFGQILIEAAVLRQLLIGLAMVLIMLSRPAGIWPRASRETSASNMGI